MVKFIAAEDVLPLRSAELRDHKPLKDCVFDTDYVEGAFHLGYFVEDEIVGVASFFPQPYPGNPESGYQLRGMATANAFKGKGYGAKLIDFAQTQLCVTPARYVWCNARTKAIGFYQKVGFELASEEFEIPGVGPHYKMILKLSHQI